MICPACQKQEHTTCVDNDPNTGTLKTSALYSSCTCAHVASVEPEPATGPAGE